MLTNRKEKLYLEKISKILLIYQSKIILHIFSITIQSIVIVFLYYYMLSLSCLRSKMIEWFRLVLQWDPHNRGRINLPQSGISRLMVFTMLQRSLSNKVCMYKKEVNTTNFIFVNLYLFS